MQLFDPQVSSQLIPILNLQETEVERQMTICNACRYCEGFCAVFPAMTRHLEFGQADIHYLANLCHNCGACLSACQYAAPHEFAVNVPKAMAKVRLETYTNYAWPQPLGKLYQRNGLTLGLASGAGLALFLSLTLMIMGNLFVAMPGGNFYGIFPHNTLALMFSAVFGFAVLALGIGVRRFWREISPAEAPLPLKASAALEAGANVAQLKYLDGGHGEGCNNADDAFTLWRRRFHHLTFYGFMLCFAATGVATLYHFLLDWSAPYPVLSLPVLLGIFGGVGLLIGPAGLLWMNLRRNPQQGDENQKPMDRGFIALLFLVSASGLALLAGRETSALGLLLAIHLGLVMAFFLTMPYSKFAHGIFRSAALLKYTIEKRQPNPISAASE
ncbi:tricarballylate utilization 4Fe-4S protein TcuB [Pseudomonas sp. JV414]|uniref:Tricarballylate utilization 4Fe-4S protein TcuB n=1 Tax=Pseudomonas serbiensis TaxID=3064350 RepID=A0ABT9CZZ6_9PSED|nr:MULTISPECIES: tricarballylate utilization 4Fe-4S protein TcuB [unclassified Pseudomonas]MDO7929660.1 tricarballylate utilization 4Fe-4S protein TcuB [Pseudomonas sp. KFB-138]MDT9673666.1 tricarballylate utilization 4Fe-4S protein TcuB [Pseudomonas sp. JV414]